MVAVTDLAIPAFPAPRHEKVICCCPPCMSGSPTHMPCPFLQTFAGSPALPLSVDISLSLSLSQTLSLAHFFFFFFCFLPPLPLVLVLPRLPAAACLPACWFFCLPCYHTHTHIALPLPAALRVDAFYPFTRAHAPTFTHTFALGSARTVPDG